jgi:hypothetical protein
MEPTGFAFSSLRLDVNSVRNGFAIPILKLKLGSETDEHRGAAHELKAFVQFVAVTFCMRTLPRMMQGTNTYAGLMPIADYKRTGSVNEPLP